MLKDEDFSVFFNAMDFAEPAEYYRKDNTGLEKVDHILVIRSTPDEVEEQLAQIIKSNMTLITVAKYEYASYEYIKLDGVYYMIYRAVKDGTGLTTLYITEDFELNEEEEEEE